MSSTYVDTNLPSNNNEPGHTTTAGVATEIANLQKIGKLPAYAPENVFMVFTYGITFDDGYNSAWCGKHVAAGVSQFYSINPFPYTSACGDNGEGGFSAEQIWEGSASHELQEAATNPSTFAGFQNPGWTINEGKYSDEIGDPCSLYADQGNMFQFYGGGYMQAVVDYLQHSCSIYTVEQDPPISIATQAASNINPTMDQIDIVVWRNDHGISHDEYISGNYGAAGTWGQWNDLFASTVGEVGTPPVSIARANSIGELDAFIVGQNNHLYHSAYVGGSWSFPWDDTGGVVIGRPAVVWYNGGLDIIVMGTNGGYFRTTWSGGSWNQLGWAPMNGLFNGPPAVLAETAGSSYEVVVGRGLDGAYWTDTLVNGGWSGWTNAGFSGEVYISEPVAVGDGSGGIAVYGQGTNWAYYHHEGEVGNGFSAIDAIAGIYEGAPSATSDWSFYGNKYNMVVGQGTNVSYYWSKNPGFGGGPWNPDAAYTGGSGISAPAMVLGAATRLIYTFVEGGDNQPWYSVGDPSAGTWPTWTEQASPSFALH